MKTTSKNGKNPQYNWHDKIETHTV